VASIIVLDDDPNIRALFSRILTNQGHEVKTAETLADFLVLMDTYPVDVVLLDVHLPDGRGEEVVPELLARDPYLFVIVISGDVSVDTAVSATKKGAYDYLTKPFTPDTLLHVVGQAIEARRTIVNQAATERNRLRFPVNKKRLVGSSPEICAVNLMIDRVAKTPSTPVLISGESGTGKEMAAEAIHQLSSRRQGPLVKVNCSAIPRPLVEAELFGHERGAFTDAREARKGLFELADGGTIFLDEIGDLDLAVQPKLLRVLEDRVITRIGSESNRKVNIRVIAASNRNLEALCKAGDFREDLYFRLAVMHITMPSLRSHPEDIERLAHMFLQEKSLELGKKIHGFSEEVLEFFRSYSWPGNVRELKNMVERLIILADSDMIELDVDSLRRYCFKSGSSLFGIRLDGSGGPGSTHGKSGPLGLSEDQILPLEEIEKSYIQSALISLGYNKTRCAKKLGISRSTLQRKIAQYEIVDEPPVSAGTD
jgi:DNA-binding NtrC family response regulator